MENLNSSSFANSMSDEKVNLTPRKWVKQVKTKDTLVRSLSYEGPSRPIKPIECVSKLKASNQATLDKHKYTSVIQMRKTPTLPTILQDISGSEESLQDAENSKGSAVTGFALVKEEEKYPDEQRRKSRKWKVLNMLRKTDSLRSNLESDADSSVNGKDVDNGSIVAATNGRPFVTLKRSTISKDLNLENISMMINFAAVNAVENGEDTNSRHPFRTFGQG